MVRGFIGMIGCFALGLFWFWLTREPVLSVFMAGIGAGLLLAELASNDPEWED